MSYTLTARRKFWTDDIVVTLDGSGNGVATYTYPEAFVGVPQVSCVKAAGAAGTFVATTTESQITITVTGDTTRLSRRILVTWWAAEKV